MKVYRQFKRSWRSLVLLEDPAPRGRSSLSHAARLHTASQPLEVGDDILDRPSDHNRGASSAEIGPSVAFDGKAGAATRYVGVGWRTEVSTHAAIAELRHAVMGRLEEEAIGTEAVSTASVLIGDLLRCFQRHAPGPIFFSLVWSRAYPVVTITIRDEGPCAPTRPDLNGLAEDVHSCLQAPIVRDRRVVVSGNAGARVVMVLNLDRRGPLTPSLL